MAAADFNTVYQYSDAYVAREFEGLSFPADTFTDNSYLEMRNLQKIELAWMFTQDTRALAFSRMMSKPITEMQSKVDSLLSQTPESALKYMIYSAHDDNITNIMKWLHPLDVEMDYILYSSQVVFELKYDSTCLQTTKNESCFRVNTRWNGNELKLNGCKNSYDSDGVGCSYTDFKAFMGFIWYDSNLAVDLDKACTEKSYNPLGSLFL